MEFSASAASAGLPFFAESDESAQEVIFGPHSFLQLGQKAKALGSRALLVTDTGLTQAGHSQKVHSNLTDCGVDTILYDRSIENPTDSSVRACAEFARSSEVDLIIGLGGGSSMDTAKGCNFILTNGGKMADYWGVGKACKPMLPLIAIPTTSGTGSECQSFALISDDQTHMKMACGDSKALPCLTILDPALTLSQPRRVTACTGIDALSHALESAVTLKRNADSFRHSSIALQLIEKNLPLVFTDPDNMDARGEVLLGASHAGAAIERSMLGAAHSMANPLTAHKGIVHGIAVGLSLPVVMAHNAEQPEVCSVYAELSRTIQLASREASDAEAAQLLIQRVQELLKLAEFPKSLSELGFSTSDLSILSKDASKQWTATFNPRPMDASIFQNLYAQLLSTSTCDLGSIE